MDGDGILRKGSSSSSEDYDYQIAFNWAIKIDQNDKLSESLSKEKLYPTEYDLTPPKPVILEPMHYRSKKQPRRRRR